LKFGYNPGDLKLNGAETIAGTPTFHYQWSVSSPMIRRTIDILGGRQGQSAVENGNAELRPDDEAAVARDDRMHLWHSRLDRAAAIGNQRRPAATIPSRPTNTP
jgi:hypothetical protein